MKKLLTLKEAMEKGIMPKQVRSSDCDETTAIMVKGALAILGLRDYIEVELDGTEMFIRACVDEYSSDLEKYDKALAADLLLLELEAETIDL